jgi:hypothetical protein
MGLEFDIKNFVNFVYVIIKFELLSRPKYKAWTKTLNYEGHLCLLSSLPTKNFGLFAHRFESFFLYSEKS